jgi:hypothetical protein
MIRPDYVARLYGMTTADLLRLEYGWNHRLMHEGLANLFDNARRFAHPRGAFNDKKDEWDDDSLPLDSHLLGGHLYRPGAPFILTEKRHRKCYHRPLHNTEFAWDEIARCLACGKSVANGTCGHVLQGVAFSTGRRLSWGKYGIRTLKTRKITLGRTAHKSPSAEDENDTESFDLRDEDTPSRRGGDETSHRTEWWISANEPEIKRRWHWSDIRPIAPEIEHRRWRRDTELNVRAARYRAPHVKVKELHDAGLTQPQIARKLKVSERTVRERMAELPEVPPKEMTAADLLALRMRAGGARNTFWPGGDSLPHGSTEAHPHVTVHSAVITPKNNALGVQWQDYVRRSPLIALVGDGGFPEPQEPVVTTGMGVEEYHRMLQARPEVTDELLSTFGLHRCEVHYTTYYTNLPRLARITPFTALSPKLCR